MTWELMDRFAAEWLPEPKILHPYPYLRFDAKYPRFVGTRNRQPLLRTTSNKCFLTCEHSWRMTSYAEVMPVNPTAPLLPACIRELSRGGSTGNAEYGHFYG
jgi:hypothetical protein